MSLINTQLFNTIIWNCAALAQEPGIDHVILFNTTSIDLRWASVPNATHYQVQVSLFSDFRTVFETNVGTDSDYQFTDAQANNQKRYWRWRPSTDGGLTYMEPFSEVGSYWLDTTAAQQIELDRNQWLLSDVDLTSDQYFFELFPIYQVVDENLHRIQQRNRLGELLSEFLTIKSNITLFFSGGQFLERRQLNEFVRFHNIVRVVYLATFKDGENARPMPHIWKAEFLEDPSFTMIAPGRPDLLQGQLTFTEV